MPEEDGTNWRERQNAQHLLQDSSHVESERGDRVKSKEESGQIVGTNEEGGRKPGGVRSSQIWLAVAFHRFVVRAYPSSGENRRRSTVVKGGDWYGEERRE